MSLRLNASAQNNEMSLGLDEAVRLALENNLNLKKSEIDLAASGYSAKHLWSEIFPTISANTSIGYTSPLVSGDGFVYDDSGKRYTFGFGLNLGLNAGTPYLLKSIKLAHQSNLLKYEDACNQLSIQVTKKFYALVAENNNLALLEEILNLAQRQYERSEVSFRNGLVGELSLTQSRLALENARYSLSAASIAHANNIGEFLAMLGMASDAKTVLLGDISILKIDADAEALIRQHLAGRPDIVNASSEIERLEYARKQSVLQSRAPSLNLSVEWNTAIIDPYTDSLSGTMRLNIPIDSWIPGTAKDQSIGRAKDSVEKAKLDLTMTEDAAKTQIRSLAALLRNSWDSITIARLSLEAAQRGYELTEQGFNNGIVESLVLEDARNGMANARQRLLQSELSYFNMILDLSAALNVDWKNLIQDFGVPSEEK
ncbi:MAG: TolC family protein [Treponema sp.]|nr:TolC family protein [Treponema sp.]